MTAVFAAGGLFKLCLYIAPQHEALFNKRRERSRTKSGTRPAPRPTCFPIHAGRFFDPHGPRFSRPFLIGFYFMSFHSLGLSKPLLDALAAKNYAQATPIQ